MKDKASSKKTLIEKMGSSMKGQNILLKLTTSSERQYLVENLAMMLHAGMGIVTALRAIQKEIKSKKMKDIVEDIVHDVESGIKLWKSFDRTGIFPSNMISLVKIGEESGRLSENLDVVSTQQQKNRMFQTKLRTAMMYPTFVFGVTIVIALGISWYILPKLSSVFLTLKIDLPLITRILLSFGQFLGNYGYIAVPVFILCVIIVGYLLFANPKTKYIGQNVLLRLPGIRNVIVNIEMARFGFILGTLIEAGLPIIRAIDSLIESTSVSAYKQLYRFLKSSIDEGNSFKKSFDIYENIRKILPIPIQQMIVAGEQSGNLSDTLIKIGESYEEKIDITTKGLAVIIEPVLLVIVWIGVVFVALAIIMPIYSLIGQF